MVWPYERPVATSRHVPFPRRRAPRGDRARRKYRRLGLHRAQRQDHATRAAVRADDSRSAGAAALYRHHVLTPRRLARVPGACRLRRRARAPRLEAGGLMLGDFKRDIALLTGRLTELRGHL